MSQAITVKRKQHLTDVNKARIISDSLGIERRRMVADERDALIELTVIKMLAIDACNKLDKRSRTIKRTRSRLGLIRWAAEWLVSIFMSSVPDEQIESMRRNLADSSFAIGTRKPVARDTTNWGLWVSFDDLETITEAGKEKCLTCDLRDGRERSCPLRKALDNLGSDIQHDPGTGCGYRWI